MSQRDKAIEQFEVVLAGGKGIKTNPNKGKGSISLRVELFDFLLESSDSSLTIVSVSF